LWQTPWTALKDGDILDCGYREFMVTPATFEELVDGGMTHVNGDRVSLQRVDRYPAVNAVLVRWTPVEAAAEPLANSYAWQAAAA
jgi:hypothetical protein